ncbi:MAG: carboxypeptidase-like regulatory domain-containing protein [Flavobacteriaceae bacterium]|nr:carboxypeptidase-like regulatory domain-containing protein [Flavobacteriaceae bacterium]
MAKYQIKINKPCTEDWYTMTDLEKGKFCDSCKKHVHDFTQYSNIELARKIKKGDKICGKFKREQINTNLFIPVSSKLNRFRYVFSFSAIFFATHTLISQNSSKKDKVVQTSIKRNFDIKQVSDSIKVKGNIVDNNGDILPGASIYLIQTNTYYESDFDGNFTFHIDKKLINKPFSLEINFVGFVIKNIIVNKNNYNSLKIILEEDNILMGEVVIITTKEPTLFQWIGNLFKKKKKPKCKNSSHKHKS